MHSLPFARENLLPCELARHWHSPHSMVATYSQENCCPYTPCSARRPVRNRLRDASIKCLPYDVLYARREGFVRTSEIARIFSRQGSGSSLHYVTRQDAGQAHAKTIGESAPSGPILLRMIHGRSEGGRKKSTREMRRNKRVDYCPTDALIAGDRLICTIVELRRYRMRCAVRDQLDSRSFLNRGRLGKYGRCNPAEKSKQQDGAAEYDGDRCHRGAIVALDAKRERESESLRQAT